MLNLNNISSMESIREYFKKNTSYLFYKDSANKYIFTFDSILHEDSHKIILCVIGKNGKLYKLIVKSDTVKCKNVLYCNLEYDLDGELLLDGANYCYAFKIKFISD